MVKCGGTLDPEPLAADVERLAGRGERVVVVHGGAPEIARLAGQLGVPQRTLLSPSGVTSRHTDPAMLDVVTLAMTGRAKPRLLRALAARGIRAVGLTGLDAGLIEARRKPVQRAVVDGRTVLVRDDHSGRITAVRPDLLHLLCSHGFVPVVSPPATDPDGNPVNVDADRVAAAVAVALAADRLALLTGAPGVLRDASDDGTVLDRCALPAEGLVPHAASGGMHRKLVAAREALLGGVRAVTIAEGRTERPLTELTGTAVELEP